MNGEAHPIIPAVPVVVNGGRQLDRGRPGMMSGQRATAMTGPKIHFWCI